MQERSNIGFSFRRRRRQNVWYGKRHCCRIASWNCSAAKTWTVCLFDWPNDEWTFAVLVVVVVLGMAAVGMLNVMLNTHPGFCLIFLRMLET